MYKLFRASTCTVWSECLLFVDSTTWSIDCTCKPWRLGSNSINLQAVWNCCSHMWHCGFAVAWAHISKSYFIVFFGTSKSYGCMFSSVVFDPLKAGNNYLLLTISNSCTIIFSALTMCHSETKLTQSWSTLGGNKPWPIWVRNHYPIWASDWIDPNFWHCYSKKMHQPSHLSSLIRLLTLPE